MKVITFHSYKGGAGKTTMAINFAVEFAKRGLKVLLVENDLLMPIFTNLFKEHMSKQPEVFINDFFFNPKETKIEDLIIPTSLNIDIICADPQFSPQRLFTLSEKNIFRTWLLTLQKTKAKLEKEHNYEAVIFDTSPGWNFMMINNLLITDYAILIVRLNKFEVIGTQRMLNEIYFKTKQWHNNLFVIWNQVPRVEFEEVLKSFNAMLPSTKQLGLIPASCKLAFEIAQGNLLLDNINSQTVKKAFKELIDRFIEILEK